MKLEEFITSQTENLIQFSEQWRKNNADKPEQFPLEGRNSAFWVRLYLNYCYREMERYYEEREKGLVEREDALLEELTKSTPSTAENAAA